jgi:hypothetical protein
MPWASSTAPSAGNLSIASMFMSYIHQCPCWTSLRQGFRQTHTHTHAIYDEMQPRSFQASKLQLKAQRVSILTWRSQTLTWPPRQPDASIWFEEGWKVMHHGVRGWPDNVLTFLPVFKSVTYTLWFPCVEATFVLQHKTNIITWSPIHTNIYSSGPL